MRTLIVSLVLALAVSVSAPAPAAPAATPRASFYFRQMSAQSIATDIGIRFKRNVVISAAGDTKLSFIAKDVSFEDALRDLAGRFSPPLSVWQQNGTYYLTPANDEATVTVSMAPLQFADASAVAKAAQEAVKTQRVTLVPITQRNAILFIGPASALDMARRTITALDVPQAQDVVSAQFFKLNRIDPTRVSPYLQTQLGAQEWSTLGVVILPAPAQGGVYISGSHNSVSFVENVIRSIDNGHVRQIDVKVELYDIQPYNDTKQIGVLYGSVQNTQGSTGTGASFTPGTFLRPNIIPGITRGLGAQIIAAVNSGHGRLVQTANIAIAVPDPLFGSAGGSVSTVSPAGTAPLSSATAPLSGNSGGAMNGVTAPVTAAGASTGGGAHQIHIGETDYVTFSANGFTQSFQIQPIQSGVTLGIEPQTVGADGLMHLTINAEDDNIIGFVNGLPRFNTRTASTDTYVRQGESIVFGGYVSDTDNFNTTKVPLLGDIPILGRLFRYDEHTTAKEQLVFVVTPTIRDF